MAEEKAAGWAAAREEVGAMAVDWGEVEERAVARGEGLAADVAREVDWVEG